MSSSAVKVLLVEDSPSDAVLLQESLNSPGNGRFEITHVERLADGLAALGRASFDVLLLDLSLPDSTGRETFLRARQEAPEVPIIVMTSVADETLALDALRHGIQDYLIKGQAYGRQTSRAIRYAIERRQMEAALQKERDQLEVRIQERTAELLAANRALHSEITRRQEAETAHLQVLRRLNEAEETERSRISRELHDRLGQDLTAMKLGLRWLEKQCPFVSNAQPPSEAGSAQTGQERLAAELRARLGQNPQSLALALQMLEQQCPFAQDAQKSVARLEQLTDGLMRDIHRLAWELHPAVLDDLGLESALRRYTEDWSEASRVPVDMHVQGVEGQRLPLELETTLFRVTQEALTNVARHANARRVSVLLERRPSLVSLILEDDGAGFDATDAFKTSGAGSKLGLLGMRERVALAGGILDLESRPGAGTTVFVRVPLPQPSATH